MMMNRDKSRDGYSLPYSKTILIYYIKTALIILLLFLIPACASTTVEPDLSSLTTANDVLTSGESIATGDSSTAGSASNIVAAGAEKIDEVISASRDVVNNNSLEWWQWVIIGMFIPTPWSIFIDMCSGIMRGFGILFRGFR